MSTSHLVARQELLIDAADIDAFKRGGSLERSKSTFAPPLVPAPLSATLTASADADASNHGSSLERSNGTQVPPLVQASQNDTASSAEVDAFKYRLYSDSLETTATTTTTSTTTTTTSTTTTTTTSTTTTSTTTTSTTTSTKLDSTPASPLVEAPLGHNLYLNRLRQISQPIEALGAVPVQQCFPQPSEASAAALGRMTDSSQEFRTPKPGHCDLPEALLEFNGMATSEAKQVCRGPFSDRRAESRRLALVLRGESFRMGGGLGDRRLSGSHAAYEAQKEASQSHIDFIIRPFEDCGFTVDVFLSSYRVSNVTDALVGWYGSRVVKSNFQKMGDGDQGTIYKSALEMVAENHSRNNRSIVYDAMIVTRFDLRFKAIPMPASGSTLNKTMFLFHEWEFCGGRKDLTDQNAVDTFLYVPWKHFNCALEVGFQEHGTLNAFKGLFGRSDLKVGDHLGYMFPNEYHDTNSKGDWNPVYNAVRAPQVLDLHGGIASVLVGVKENPMTCQTCVHSVLRQAYTHGIPVNDAADLYVHSWSPNSTAYYKEHLRDRFNTFAFENLTETALISGFPAWGQSTMLALKAVRQQEQREGTPEFCTRPEIDYDLVMVFRDDVDLQCTHNAAWYQEKIPTCQGWKTDCSKQEPVVGVGFGGASPVDFSAVPTVVVTNSFGARRIADQLAILIEAGGPWPRADASEDAVLTWFRKNFAMPVRQVCRHC